MLNNLHGNVKSKYHNLYRAPMQVNPQQWKWVYNCDDYITIKSIPSSEKNAIPDCSILIKQ